jgi:hypothetical protein
MELAPFPGCYTGTVAKASSGHFPLPFLISGVVKNWRKDISAVFNFPKKILKNIF